jgi:hypothetical protein
LKDDEELKKLNIDPTRLNSLPFQTQVTYTSLAGHRLLRVITSTCETTTNKSMIEKVVEMPVVHARIAHRTAELQKIVEVDRVIDYNRQMVEYVDKNLVQQHQKVENMKFTDVNNRVQQAYINKAARSKPIM